MEKESIMSELESDPEKRIALFQRKEIRRVIHNNEWWFVITDVVAALTDSVNPKGYFTDMRRREPQLVEALKGGGKLPPPLVWSLTQQAGVNYSNAGIPKASSALSNPSPAPKPSRSNAGSRASATNAFRKLKTRNSPPNAPAPSTKPKATPTTGLKSGCVPSPSATN